MSKGLPILVTPEGHKKVTSELEHLWRVERPQVTAEVEAAAALGDRSENAEYQYGKRRLREIDRRLRFLSDRLDRMKVVTPRMQAAKRGKVGFGAWVVLEDDEGERKCYRIVGADESDADRGHISLNSPVAKALLGKVVGDEVEVRRPRGEAYFTIEEIVYGDRPAT
jgi:transcription elongation factor GreB